MLIKGISEPEMIWKRKEQEFNFRCCFIRFKKKKVSRVTCSNSQELHGPTEKLQLKLQSEFMALSHPAKVAHSEAQISRSRSIK